MPVTVLTACPTTSRRPDLDRAGPLPVEGVPELSDGGSVVAAPAAESSDQIGASPSASGLGLGASGVDDDGDGDGRGAAGPFGGRNRLEVGTLLGLGIGLGELGFSAAALWLGDIE
jgi:hypothetical protein